MSRPGKKIVCRVRVDERARSAEFTWSEGAASFKPYTLVDDQFTFLGNNIEEARARLFRLVQLHQQPFEDRDADVYRRSCLELAQAGNRLYSNVFDRAARGEQVTAIRDWIRGLTAAGGIESLEVVCDGAPWFAPWNLLYDRLPKEAEFAATADGTVPAGFDPFWGVRYNLCGGQTVDPLRRVPLPTAPDVLMVLDPKAVADLAEYSEPDGSTQRDRLERFVADRGLEAARSPDELADALSRRRPHLIYWLGHADRKALWLGGDSVDQPTLRYLLNEMSPGDGQVGGLVFLNCCQTAERGDVGSFLQTFHDYGFSGLIATEEHTLDSFANPFGLGILEAFLVPDTAIGVVLHGMRRGHPPLSLLYGAYCPPDLHLRPEPAAAPNPERARAADTTAAGGRALGASAVAAGPSAVTEADRAPAPLPDVPYLPLGTYGPEHRALFAGRDADVARCAMVLGRPETRVLVLHGESGVGKSSFLRAGLIPFLEEDCIGYRFLRDRRGEGPAPILFVRATGDPAGQVAQALVQFCERPYRFETPTGEAVEVDLAAELAAAIGGDAPAGAEDVRDALLAEAPRLGAVLARLSAALPQTLVLVLDQAEEVMTLADAGGPAARDRSLAILGKLTDAEGDFKVILSLRTEFYGRLIDAFRRARADAGRVRDYLLADLDEPTLIEAILRPTADDRVPHTSEVPRDRYRFRYAEGVAEELAHALLAEGKRDGVLPLVQVICGQLYDRLPAPDRGAITHDDLAAIGGVRGGLARHVEGTIARITGGSPLERSAFRRLLCGLYLRQPDGTLTTALIPAEELARSWHGRQPFDRALRSASDSRILRVNTLRVGPDARPYVSLGHDAVAKVAADWDEERRRVARARKVVAIAAVAVLFFGAVAWLQRQDAIRSARDARELAKLAEEASRQRKMAEENSRKAEDNAAEAARNAEKAARNAADAEAGRRAARRQLAEVYLERGRSLCERGEVDRGMLWLARAMEYCQADDRELAGLVRRIVSRWAAEVATLAGLYPAADVLGFAYTPEGRAIVALAEGEARPAQAVQLHDAETGAPIGALMPHDAPVRRVIFDPTARRVLTTTAASTVRLWDADTGRPVAPTREGQYPPPGGPGHPEDAFNADGSVAFTLEAGWSYRVSDPVTGADRGPAIRVNSPLQRVVFSPDGAAFAGADASGSVRVWEASTAMPRTPVLRHPRPVGDLVFSPGGETLATVAGDGVRFWDARDGHQIGPRLTLREPVEAIEASPEGRTLVTRDGTALRLWDAARGTPIGAIDAGSPRLQVAGFSADGRWLAAADGERLWIYDVAGATLAGPPLPHPAGVDAIRFRSDGARVATAGSDRRVRLFDPAAGRSLIASGAFAQAVTSLTFVGPATLAASHGPETDLWDADTGAHAGSMPPGWARVAALLEVGRGRYLAVVTAGKPAAVNVYAPGDRRARGAPLGHDQSLNTILPHPDGSSLLVARGGRARLHAMPGGETQGEAMDLGGPLGWAAFTPDGRHLATADRRGARVWDTATGRPVGPSIPEGGAATAWAVSSDGSTVATHLTGTIRLWNAATGAEIRPPVPARRKGLEILERMQSRPPVQARGPGLISGLAFRPGDGALVLRPDFGADIAFPMVWEPETVSIWEPATSRRVDPPLIQEVAPLAVEFLPDGRAAVVIGQTSAQLRDVATGEPLGAAIVDRESFRVAPSRPIVHSHPDGRSVITVVRSDVVRIRDARTGEPLGEDSTAALADIAPDRRTLIVRSVEGARLWDAGTGRPIGELMPHGAPIDRVVYSPDGRVVAAVDQSSTIRLWDAHHARPLAPLRLESKLEDASPVVFSPDGTTVAVADGVSATIWKVADGSRIGSFANPSTRNLCFSADSRLVAAIGTEIRLLDAATAAPVAPPFRAPAHPNVFTFRRDGREFLAGSVDDAGQSHLQAWDRSGGTLHATDSASIFIGPDASTIVAGQPGEYVHFWRAKDGAPIGEPSWQEEGARGLLFSRDGRRAIITTGRAHDLRDGRTGHRVCELRAGPSPPEFRVGFSPDGRLFATQDPEGPVWLRDTETGRPAAPPLPGSRPLEGLQFSPDGQTLVTWTTNGARVWDVATARPVAEIRGWRPERKVLFSKDGMSAAFWSDRIRQATATTWHVADGTAFVDNATPFLYGSMEFSPLGQRLISSHLGTGKPRLRDPFRSDGVAVNHPGEVTWAGFLAADVALTLGRDGTVRFWDAATAGPRGMPLRHRGPVTVREHGPNGRTLWTGDATTRRLWVLPGLAPGAKEPHLIVGPGGRTVATALGDGVRLWDGPTGRPIGAKIPCNSLLSRSAWFSPDGAVFVAKLNQSLSVWDAATGTPAGTGQRIAFDGFTPSIAFRPDGRRLATQSGSLVQICALPEVKLLGRGLAHESSVSSVEFSPDGANLTTRTVNGTVSVWEAESGRLLAGSGATSSPESTGPDVAAPAGAWHGIRLWDTNTGEPVPPAELDEALATGPGRPRRPLEGDPRALTLWVQASTGLELDEAGATHVLTAEQWRARCDRFRELTGRTHVEFRREPWYAGLEALYERSGGDTGDLWQFDRLIAADTRDPGLSHARASALAKLGRFGDAADEYRAALALGIADRGDRRQYLFWLIRAGRPEEALAACRAFLGEDPKDVWMRDTFRALLLATGDVAGFRRECEARRRELGEPRDPKAANAAAWLGALVPDAVADLGHCLRLARRAVAADHSFPAQHSYANTLGGVLYRAGQYDEAARTLETWLDQTLLPSDWVFYALAHHRLGHREKAREALDRAIVARRRRGPYLWPTFTTWLEDDALIDEAVREIIGRGPSDLPDDVFAGPGG
jgi:WD40 repeat protein/tetratricopeptide (TPR) repeat protein